MIEAAASPADESWRNINAMDDLTLTLIAGHRTASWSRRCRAMPAPAACSWRWPPTSVWARRGVVLNPHYKNMGNLYGSEYWTYLLPRRLKSSHGGRA